MKKIKLRDIIFLIIGALLMFIINILIDQYNESRTVKGKVRDGFKSIKKEFKK